MTALEQLRAAQHDERRTAADIDFVDWLAKLDPDAVLAEQAVHWTPAEIALMRRAS